MLRSRPVGQLMVLWTGAIIGWPGLTPNSVRIGMSVAPKASKVSCDSHTSNTCRPSFSPNAAW